MKTLLLLCSALMLVACSGDELILESERGSQAAGKADGFAGVCAVDDCGSPDPSADGCYCDDSCADYGDCCLGDHGAAFICGVAVGTCTEVAGASKFFASSDGMQCEQKTTHCVTDDSSACPQLSPLPPDYCPDGSVVQGAPAFIPSSDGMECSMPSVHCVTNDLGNCPLYSLPPPEYCEDGTLVEGVHSYIPSADGMECELPSLICVTNDVLACPY